MKQMCVIAINTNWGSAPREIIQNMCLKNYKFFYWDNTLRIGVLEDMLVCNFGICLPNYKTYYSRRRKSTSFICLFFLGVITLSGPWPPDSRGFFF